MSSSLVKSLSLKFELLRIALSGDDIILITGLPSTGKTTVTMKVLEENPEYLSVYINCNNVATVSRLYLEILRLFHQKLSDKPDRRMFDQIMITSLEFKERYRKLHAQALKQGYERIYIVLDQIELFKKTPMMDAMIFLTNERKYLNFILISGENGLDLLEGIHSIIYRTELEDRLSIVELNPWNKEDLIDSILEQLPSESVKLYKKFVHNVVSIVYENNTKDFVELRSFCQDTFPDFLEFYKKKACEIYRRFGEEVDLKYVDFDDFDDRLPVTAVTSSCSAFFASFKDLIRKGEVRDWGNMRVDRSVAYHTAALIVAAYVAAYTRPFHDKHNFVTYQKRISKRARQEHSDNDPKAFTMERLIQIYRGILIILENCKEDNPDLRQDSVLSDIQLLQDLDLIFIAAGDGLDSQTRYRISHHVSHDYIRTLSRSISFQLDSLTGAPTIPK